MKAILIALLISLTPSMAQAQDQRVLKMGKIAPFSGVLVPASTYKQIVIDIESKDIIKNAYDEKVSDYKLLSSYYDRQVTYVFWGSLVTGIMAGYWAGKQ